VLLLALLAAGCGGRARTPADDPGTFMRGIVLDLYQGRTGEAWDQLHPFLQQRIPRARYIACERAAPIVGTPRRVDVVRVANTVAEVPGKPGKEPSKEITLRVVIALPNIRHAEPIFAKAHVFAVHGRWAWVIGGDYAGYADGGCPGGPDTRQ
jgi:hypothetical protein